MPVLCGFLLIANVALATPASPQPSIAYTIRFDARQLGVVDVALRLEHVPPSFRLAMKVHAEYDARYWRYLDALRVEGSADDSGARVAREDSTLWRVTMPGGRGVVRYRVHIQREAGALRDAWRPFAVPTGALINPPDFLLYLPDFATGPATVHLDIPPDWRIATALAPSGGHETFTAPDAAALLDSPILLGRLREWSFNDAGTTFHVVYWPLPDAAAFDTVAFIDGLRRLTHAAVEVFGRAPSREFFFLLQDGAGDALEHRASVTIGIPSAALARNPHAYSSTVAHEFFHTWNLVAIHPDRYGELSFRPPAPTTGLWWGEGVTLYYAEALPRRAGIADTSRTRLENLSDALRSYYAAWWSNRVSPERASLAFGASPVDNENATGGYYVQGQLLAQELDALLRDSTHDARGLDDVMRAMFARSTGGRGFTTADLEAVTDSICGCRLRGVFAAQVRGSALIDLRPLAARLGLQVVVDTVQATDDAGALLPDLRVGIDFSRPDPPRRLVVPNPASAWRAAGLRTGDTLVAMSGAPISAFPELRRLLQTLHVGDSVAVDVKRAGRALRIVVPIASYRRPRVRFVDGANVSAELRARRARWLAGW